MAPKPRKRRIVLRSVVVRERSWPVCHLSCSSTGSRCSRRVEAVADLPFDLHHGEGLDAPACHDEGGLEEAEADGEQEHRYEGAAIAAADRPVHDSLENKGDEGAGGDGEGGADEHHEHLAREYGRT